MKKVYSLALSIVLVFLIVLFCNPIKANAIMGDKTEIPVNLEVSGAEALCQTDDGFVWIAQYSGLVRYDSKDFKNFKSFEYKGEEHSVLNVRFLAKKHNTLFIATSNEILILENEVFSMVDYDFSEIQDLVFDDLNDLLYISTKNGALTYNVLTKVVKEIEITKDSSISDIALDVKRNSFYYQNELGIFDKDGNEILDYPKVTDLYSFDNILYIAEDTGIIHR